MSAQAAGQRRKSISENRRSLLRLTEAQAALSWGIILAIGMLVGGIYLFQASRIATTGRQVQGLQRDLNEIKRINNELERDIAEAQSLDRLQNDALRLGFTRTQPENVEYLVVPEYPENTPTLEVEPAIAVDLPETFSEAVWLSLKTSLGGFNRGVSP